MIMMIVKQKGFLFIKISNQINQIYFNSINLIISLLKKKVLSCMINIAIIENSDSVYNLTDVTTTFTMTIINVKAIQLIMLVYFINVIQIITLIKSLLITIKKIKVMKWK
jgi:Na+/H+-dicarboxylate symporter